MTGYLTISLKPSSPKIIQSYLGVWRCLEPPKALESSPGVWKTREGIWPLVQVAPGAFATRRCSILPRHLGKHGPWAMKKNLVVLSIFLTPSSTFSFASILLKKSEQILGIILPSTQWHGDFVINHYKDPCEASRNQWKVRRVFSVAQIVFFWGVSP